MKKKDPKFTSEMIDGDFCIHHTLFTALNRIDDARNKRRYYLKLFKQSIKI